MGVYATTTAISELVPGFLRGNTTSSDTAGMNLFSRHIDRAEGIVNAYVTAKYSLPFITATSTTNVPTMVRTLSEDIASWYAARAAYAQDGQRRQEYLDRFEGAIKQLEDIRDGKTKLAYTDGSVVPNRSSARMLSTTEGYAHVFNMDDPKNWGVDQDQIDDIEGDRT